MTVRLTMTTTGAEKLRARLSNRINFLGEAPVRAQLQEMGRYVVERYQHNIASFTPGSAQDLSPAYKKWKKKKTGRAYPILVLTGQFLSSIYSRVFKEKGWTIKVKFAGKHAGGISNEELARIHIEGDGPPKRDFTKLPPNWNKDFINRLLNKSRR